MAKGNATGGIKNSQSSKNASGRQNLLSDKSSHQQSTPTTASGIGISLASKNKDYNSHGVAAKQGGGGDSNKNSATNKASNSIKKKLQQQLEGALSRNENTVKTSGSGGGIKKVGLGVAKKKK